MWEGHTYSVQKKKKVKENSRKERLDLGHIFPKSHGPALSPGNHLEQVNGRECTAVNP